MLNEFAELEAYTTFPAYTAAGKRDTAYLGRFTFDMLKDFIGFHRVLTILARGYMFDAEEPDIDRARRALCAWCSLPETKKAAQKAAWQYETTFRRIDIAIIVDVPRPPSPQGFFIGERIKAAGVNVLNPIPLGKVEEIPFKAFTGIGQTCCGRKAGTCAYNDSIRRFKFLFELCDLIVP